VNCPPGAEHPLLGLGERVAARFGGTGGMTYDGLGDRLTVPTTVTGNAGLTGSTAKASRHRTDRLTRSTR
jgi:hypothetical protein